VCAEEEATIDSRIPVRERKRESRLARPSTASTNSPVLANMLTIDFSPWGRLHPV
jgi:hypothetical protein